MIAFGSGVVVPAMAQQTFERVEITGSSIRRVDAETALPVTVIKLEELTRQGVTTAEQAIQRISANQSNFGQSASIGATTGGKAEADLRGLGGPTGANGNKTLVLLNGRRIVNHSFDAAAVDLNAIPLNAIDRIEVLRDGASAIYGTDAIGGVINFILKRDYQGFEMSAQTMLPQKSGGGQTQRITGTLGWGSLATNGFNFMGSLDFRNQHVLEAAQRSFSESGIIRGNVQGGTSGTSFPGDLNGYEPTLPNCVPPGSIPNAAGTACRYDFSRDVDIIPKNQQATALVKGSLALGPDHVASVEYLHAKNLQTSRVAAAPTSHLMPESSPFYPRDANGVPLPIGTVGGIPDINNPGGPNVPGGVVNWRQIPAGKRTSGDDSSTDRLLAELNGSVSGWDYKTGVGTSSNTAVASVSKGYVNDGLMQQGVFDGVINPFGAQTAGGQAAIDAAQVSEPTQIGKARVNFIDFKVSRELMQMSGGAMGFAFGAEARKEKSSFEATDITGQLGSLGIDPDSDTSGKRKVYAAFAELNMPVMKNLEINVAARYDKYSDFGDTFNPKIGIRYQPTDQLVLRGSANTGFRAPTLYEIHQPASLTFTSDPYDDPLLCPGGVAVPGAQSGVVCGQQVLQRLSGPSALGLPASTLKPEKSTNFNLGMVFEPVKNTSLGIDFWSIEVKNLISPLPEQAVFGDPAKYSSRFVRCSQIPATGTGITQSDIDACLGASPTFDPIAFIDVPTENLGTLKTNGIDLSASWRSGATSAGVWGVAFEGTYVNKYKYQREKGGDYINAKGRYSDNAPVFKWQHYLTASWSMGPWSALIAQRYKTGYTDQDGVNKVKDYFLHDISATFAATKDLSLQVGVNNVFDKDPPLSGQSTTFQRGYDPRFTDPIGRNFVLRASYKFF
ncbi:MAG: TonB-dependent receptor [Burkholderiales bacterium]|nr:TonB-dependent receptor [Burkholderiales bacterium]